MEKVKQQPVMQAFILGVLLQVLNAPLSIQTLLICLEKPQLMVQELGSVPLTLFQGSCLQLFWS